jgi:hypothetical protein
VIEESLRCESTKRKASGEATVVLPRARQNRVE